MGQVARRVLQMNVRYERCIGAELYTAEGRRISMFDIAFTISATATLGSLRRFTRNWTSRGPAMLQSHTPVIAGELAEQPCNRAGGRFKKVYFASSGSEGIKAAIKFSRAHTSRHGTALCGRRLSRAHLRRALLDGRSILANWLRPAAARRGSGFV